jgi:hypothetical protein
MADFSIEQLKSNPLADSPSTPFNIVSAARNGVCNTYRAAPGLLTQPDGAFSQPFEAISDAYRGFLDDLCGDQALPPIGPRFGGGRCAIPYVVSYETKVPISPSGQQTGSGTVTLTGPIGGMQLRQVPGSPNQMEFVISHQGGQFFFGVLSFDKTQPRAGEHTASVTGITAVNPALDTCGGLSPRFPERVTGPTDYNPPVQYRDRGTQIDVNVNIPPIIIPPGAVQIRPNIEVKIGPNKVNFDLSGGELKLEVNPNLEVNIGNGKGNPNTNPPISPAPGLDGELIADRFDRIEDLLEDLENCACNDADLSTLVATSGNNANSQCVSISVGRNKFCAIAITQRPANEKSQAGLNAPDVLYAGWAWFKTGDYLFERAPVDCEGKIFKNPGNASAFCYTLYAGYLGTPIILDKPISDE